VANFETVTTPDGRVLEYLVSGPPAGRTLLFQPGTPNAAALFRAIVEPAAELGLRTVSYSRPGYGESTPRPGAASPTPSPTSRPSWRRWVLSSS
jgi:pimeloyl-ACP methyl ester carboxylesterase